MAGPDEFRQSSSSTAMMPFIVSSNVEKVDPVTRKLIRSHVMRGKKQKRKHTVSKGLMVGHIEAVRVKMEEISETWTCAPLVPCRVGSDLSFVEFAHEVEPSMLLNITKDLVSPIAMRVIFPLLMAIGFQADNKEWLHILGQDPVALHISVFAVEGFIDKILHCRKNSINEAALLHFQKGLGLLRERILGQDDEVKISDSTIGIVLKLAGAAHFNGDHTALEQHLGGLRKMVDLRGGLDVFKNRLLLVEMLRYDLGNALLTGSNTVFFCEPSEPVPEYPEELLSAADKNIHSKDINLTQSFDANLAAAWGVMKRFCLLINLGTQTQRFIRPDLIHQTMTAVMYRLLHMSFTAGSIDDVLRHGLLAFSYHVFLQWQDVKLPYDYFTTIYKQCILRLKLIDRASPQLMIWLLMIGAISVFDISDEAWMRAELQQHAKECQVKTWKEMQDILKSLMWVLLLDEERGAHVYEILHLDEKDRKSG